MTILHGDMRFYNNVFVQGKIREEFAKICNSFVNDEWDDWNLIAGTLTYSDYMTSEEWEKEFEGYCGYGSEPSDRYYMPLPVWTGGNVFFNGAKPCTKEEKFHVDTEHEVKIELVEDENGWRIESDLFDYLPADCELISTDTLGMAFEPEQRFEAPDGSDIVFDTDIKGKKREGGIKAGPFA